MTHTQARDEIERRSKFAGIGTQAVELFDYLLNIGDAVEDAFDEVCTDFSLV